MNHYQLAEEALVASQQMCNRERSSDLIATAQVHATLAFANAVSGGITT